MLPETPTQETKATKRSESYSRFVEGNRCRWRRLLGYYYNGRGISGPDSLDLVVGSSVHKCLETVLKARGLSPIQEIRIGKIVEEHRQAVTRMVVDEENPQQLADESTAMVETLAAAWTRITLPWVLDKFEILAVESPEQIEVSDPEGGSVTFRSRADFIAREKASGLISIHDFKTVSYWDDDSAELWHYNIQMYATAYCVQQRLGHVPHYYIHPLLKGNKRYPSPIIKPWVAPAVTPLGKPVFSLTWKKNLERDWAYKYMPVQTFIDSLPAEKLTKFVPVAGPYGTDEEMARDFLSGAVTENRWWYDNLDEVDWDKWGDPDHHAKLVRTFPRSYACWDFKKLCPYHRICFRQKGWQEPLTFGYKTRTFDK